MAKPMAGNIRPAQFFDEPVIAAAAGHGILSPQLGGDHLKGGSGIIIQPPHQPRIFSIGNMKTLQEFHNPVLMLLAGVTELVGNGRNLSEQILAGL